MRRQNWQAVNLLFQRETFNEAVCARLSLRGEAKARIMSRNHCFDW